MHFFAPHEYNLQIFSGEKIILKEIAEIKVNVVFIQINRKKHPFSNHTDN